MLTPFASPTFLPRSCGISAPHPSPGSIPEPAANRDLRPVARPVARPCTVLRALAVSCAVAWLLAGTSASAQVTIDREGRATDGTHAAAVDRRFAQVEPTKVDLSKLPMDPRNRQEVIRIMQSEQGFAMRPFPKGHKGLSLVANGKLEPAGEPFLEMITKEGTSAKPGDRLVLTDVRIENNKIVFDINGGPDHKHNFLRHVQIGSGPTMNPVVQDNNQDPQGSRLTLDFKGRIPELTGSQVKALLAPLISFDVKTPVQAFTDTLPPQLKAAILNHHVMVGMSTDMVLFALGQPQRKIREMEGQMPFEEWIYGAPPKDVQFVRVNGNRVIRLEVAKMGEKPEIFEKDEVEGMMRTDGTPLVPATTKTVAMGDVVRDPNTQAPDTPPSLRNPGEALPHDDDKKSSVGVMRPVQFPKQKPDDHPDASKLPRQKPTDEEGRQPQPDAPQPAGAGTTLPAPPPPDKPND